MHLSSGPLSTAKLRGSFEPSKPPPLDTGLHTYLFSGHSILYIDCKTIELIPNNDHLHTLRNGTSVFKTLQKLVQVQKNGQR